MGGSFKRFLFMLKQPDKPSKNLLKF